MEERDAVEGLLRKILAKLEELSSRVDRIEAALSSVGINHDVLRMSLQLSSTMSTSLASALEYAMRAWKIIESIAGLCPLSKSIIATLSDCAELSISDVYRRVKRMRGRASRRIVGEKLRSLESMGIVINVGTGARPRYVLKICKQKR